MMMNWNILVFKEAAKIKEKKSILNTGLKVSKELQLFTTVTIIYQSIYVNTNCSLLLYEHSQKLIGVLRHFNPLALVAHVAHDKVTQNINTGNCGGKIKL